MVQIIPRAIDYFTGKALEYEDFDDDDDFEDIDDDDDEAEPGLVKFVGEVKGEEDTLLLLPLPLVRALVPLPFVP